MRQCIVDTLVVDDVIEVNQPVVEPVAAPREDLPPNPLENLFNSVDEPDGFIPPIIIKQGWDIAHIVGIEFNGDLGLHRKERLMTPLSGKQQTSFDSQSSQKLAMLPSAVSVMLKSFHSDNSSSLPSEL